MTLLVNFGPLFMCIKTKMSIYDFLWAHQAIMAFIYEITRNQNNYFIEVCVPGRVHHWQCASYQTCLWGISRASELPCFCTQSSTLFYHSMECTCFLFLGSHWLWRYLKWEVPKQTLWGEWEVPKQTLLGEREVPKQTLWGEWEVPKQTLWGEWEVPNFSFLTEISIGDRDLQVCPATTCTYTYSMRKFLFTVLWVGSGWKRLV